MTPKPIRDLRTIEITSQCNLACGYCLHPTMGRPKVHMTEEIWQASLAWLRFFVQLGTQAEVNLSGTGEPTMHPDLVRFVAQTREVLGPYRDVQFTTNGKGLTEALADALVPYQPKICVTAHHANLAGPAAALLKARGLLRDVSIDPVLYPQDWAGQLKWPHPPKPLMVCAYLEGGLGYVSADGKFYVCCMDGTGESTLGDVRTAPHLGILTKDWRVCPACWQSVPVH